MINLCNNLGGKTYIDLQQYPKGIQEKIPVIVVLNNSEEPIDDYDY